MQVEKVVSRTTRDPSMTAFSAFQFIVGQMAVCSDHGLDPSSQEPFDAPALRLVRSRTTVTFTLYREKF
jgi:hypothetical protein